VCGWSRFACGRRGTLEAALTTTEPAARWLTKAPAFDRENWRVKLDLVPHVAALQAAVVIIALILQAG
jgi:hypothetical protein